MKKRILKIIILTMLIKISLLLNPVFSQDSGAFQPTQPPRIPVTNYGDGSHYIFDFMYMYYDMEAFKMAGVAGGYNYVNNYNNLGYNIGIGILYMEGVSKNFEPEIFVYDMNLPLNANIAIRLAGTQDTSNFMIFGGIHWMYSWITVTYGDIDAYADGSAYGPLFGIKAEIKLTPSVSIIPYYMHQETSFDMSVSVEGVEQDVDIDSVTSDLFGFDIKIGSFSIGALLDSLNNTDDNKITIICSYDFNYPSTGSSVHEQNAADKKDYPEETRGKTKKKRADIK